MDLMKLMLFVDLCCLYLYVQFKEHRSRTSSILPEGREQGGCVLVGIQIKCMHY